LKLKKKSIFRIGYHGGRLNLGFGILKIEESNTIFGTRFFVTFVCGCNKVYYSAFQPTFLEQSKCKNHYYDLGPYNLFPKI